MRHLLKYQYGAAMLFVAECPAGAIFADMYLLQEQEKFIEINARLAKQWPVVSLKTDPPSDADKWNGVEGKMKYLEE